jgi:hypothetical protein
MSDTFMSRDKRRSEMPQGVKWSNQGCLVITRKIISVENNRLESYLHYTSSRMDGIGCQEVLRVPLVEISRAVFC